MKAELTFSPELVDLIADRVIEKLKPLLTGNGVNDDRYLTTKELAKYLGVAYSTVANNKKYLPHTYFNSIPLFKKSDIDNLLQQSSIKPNGKEKNQKFKELFNSKR